MLRIGWLDTALPEETVLKMRLITLTLLGTVLMAPATPQAQPRVNWETDSPEITERTAPDAEFHRVAPLKGRLSALSRGDVRLYAVYLERRGDTGSLMKVLREVGSPAGWREAGESETLGAFLTGPGSYEWIELQVNGAFTLYADNHRQPGKDYVVIINGAGDILGARPLWSAPDGDFAGLSARPTRSGL
jgi:hypothetical protein